MNTDDDATCANNSADSNAATSTAADSDADKKTVISEGKANAICIQYSSFYNPVQEFNRDLSVCVLRRFIANLKVGPPDTNEPARKKAKLYADPSNVTVIEALAATGLRAIRYAKEVPGISTILANDFSDDAVATIKANVASNGVENIVTPNFGDAVSVLHEHKRRDKRFHCVDLDPYGCPSIFLDSAVQAVCDGGILMVTSTDMAVLCGNSPETCHSKYGATSAKIKSCHEQALRIVVQCIESHANRYSRYIVPLLSVSADFYVRVFVQVFSGQGQVKHSVCKLGYLLHCVGCGSFTIQPMATKDQRGTNYKFSLPHIVQSVGERCEHCSVKLELAGPLWIDRIHSVEFVEQLLADLKSQTADNAVNTSKRIIGMLSVILEELHDTPLFYIHDQAKNTDGDKKLEKISPNTPGYNILSQTPRFEVNFDIHVAAEPPSKLQGLLRYQPNPAPNWGPGCHAKGSISSKSQAVYAPSSPDHAQLNNAESKKEKPSGLEVMEMKIT